METLFTTSDFDGIDDAHEVVTELEAFLALRYPRLIDLEDVARDRLLAILRPIVRRWVDVGTGVQASTKTGPFAESLREDGLNAGHTLTEAEMGSLSALCASVGITVLPRSSFPPPESLDGLFARRKHWVNR